MNCFENKQGYFQIAVLDFWVYYFINMLKILKTFLFDKEYS